ncbi:MAG: nuclear transport factor 2 family protein [Ilumatobacteraceae bacterium]
MTGTGEPTGDVVRAYICALNSHDRDAISAAVTDDFVNEHIAVRGHSLVGRAAYRERLAGFLTTFQSLAYEIEDVIADGDRAAVAYTMRADHCGADGRADRRPIEVRGMFRFTVRGGLIAHRVDYRDSATVEQQLGHR